MDNFKFFRSSIFHCLDNNNEANGVAGEYFADGLLALKNGKVADVGHYEKMKHKFGKDTKITHFKDSLIIPGFIDPHLHYPQYKIIGSYGATLLDWLAKYTFVEEAKFSDENYCQEVSRLFFDEIIKNGTTTALTFATSHKQSVEAFFSEAEKRNLRMIAGKVMMDRNAPENLIDSAESGYTDSKNLIETWHNHARLQYAVTPRFAPTSSPEQLQKAAELMQEFNGDEGVLMQSHINENAKEIAWVQQLYPECSSYFDVYEQFGLTTEKSIFAHGIHNTKDELARMQDTGIKIALCPSSNLFLGSGLFDLQQLQNYQINTALASDIGGGDSFSMFQVMNQAYKVAKLQDFDLTATHAFYLATLAGAKMLHVDKYLGNFEPNKEADFLVLDFNATTLISKRLESSENIDDLLFSLMILGDDRLISRVFILGNLVYQKEQP